MNDQNIEEIISALYDLVQDARSMPLAADKCILERDKVLDMLDEIIEVIQPREYVHMGHDEVYGIGICPICGKEARKEVAGTKLNHTLTGGYPLPPPGDIFINQISENFVRLFLCHAS